MAVKLWSLWPFADELCWFIAYSSDHNNFEAVKRLVASTTSELYANLTPSVKIPTPYNHFAIEALRKMICLALWIHTWPNCSLICENQVDGAFTDKEVNDAMDMYDKRSDEQIYLNTCINWYSSWLKLSYI